MVVQRVKWAIVLLIALAVLVGCTCAPAQGGDATPTPIATPVVPDKPTYVVQRGEVAKVLEFTARVSPISEEELFFRVSGYVGEVFVERDDWVKAGDLLAELEVSDLKNQLLQAEAALGSTISSNEQQIAEAQASLRTAELNLAIAEASDPAPQIVFAEVSLERARMSLADAQEAYNEAWDAARDWELNVKWRKAGLEAERESTERGLKEAQLSLRVAEADYQQALQNLQVHAYNVQIREQEVALVQLRLEKLESGLAIEEMRLNVERLKAQLDDARLIAPFDGQVLLVTTAEGRAVTAYKPVMVVANVDALEVSTQLDADEMEELQEGMEVICEPVGRPGQEFAGYIRRLPYPYGGGSIVGTTEDEDQSTRIALEQDPEELGLELDDRVHVTVVLERKADVFWVPPQAISQFEGRRFIVIQDGDRQRTVDVNVGIEGTERVEIEGVTEELVEGWVVIGR
ncbi:MAG: biotin/lipoyl-binding protein [Anaerolineae bacterium]|nr:biotin/lipoyl-binding protein [Anaerolineae bacterium]